MRERDAETKTKEKKEEINIQIEMECLKNSESFEKIYAHDALSTH